MTLQTGKPYGDSIRCSIQTKKKILIECKGLLFPINNWGDNAYINIPHWLIMERLVDEVLAKKEAIIIPPSILNKIKIDCKAEYLKYNKDKADVSTNELLDAIATHYIESDPRR